MPLEAVGIHLSASQECLYFNMLKEQFFYREFQTPTQEADWPFPLLASVVRVFLVP